MEEELTDINKILDLEKPLFCDYDTFKITISSPPLQFNQYRDKMIQCQDLYNQIQITKDTCTKLESEQDGMIDLLKECKELRLKEIERKEYLQAFLMRLTKKQTTKEGELSELKSKRTCREKDKIKLLEMKKSSSLYELLFGAKVSPKYSNSKMATLMVEKLSLSEPTAGSSEENRNEKENSHVLVENNPRKAWTLLEKRSDQKPNGILSIKNSLVLRKK